MHAIQKLLYGDEKEMEEVKISSRSQLMKSLREYGYHNCSEVERDILEVLASFKELQIVLDTYVSNSGIENQLVCLRGTIPVNYKGNDYNIPICFWLSKEHPKLPPLVQVEPTHNMSIKVGDNVDSAGMVTMAYLDEWQKTDCDLSSLIQILSVMFGENCPVYSRPSQSASTYAGRASPKSAERALPKEAGRSSPQGQPSYKGDNTWIPIAKKTSFKKDNNLDARLYHDEAKSRREALLLQVDDLLNKARVAFVQAESMINVLETSKSELIKGSPSQDRLDSLEIEMDKIEDWRRKHERRLEEQSTLADIVRSSVKNIEEFELQGTSRLLDADKYKQWTNDDVCQWFQSIGMSQFVPSVKEHSIRGIHLPNLTKEDLLELGVVKLGERMTIDDAINKLCNDISNIS